MSGHGQMRELVLLYAGGLSAIYYLFALLYANGYRQRDKLQLTPLERALTRTYILEEAGTATIGVLVCIVALVWQPALATLIFMLIGAWKSYAGRRAGNIGRRMGAQAEAIQPVHEPHA
jgi:hypothetical protein